MRKLRPQEIKGIAQGHSEVCAIYRAETKVKTSLMGIQVYGIVSCFSFQMLTYFVNVALYGGQFLACSMVV